MVSPETPPATTAATATATASPRISFSADFLDDENFICITPQDKAKEKPRTGEFEFLSGGDLSGPGTMLTADELFFEGKLLPFWQKEKPNKITIKTDQKVVENEEIVKSTTTKEDQSNRMSWFIDEDPSPRPPKCTVLWKELLRLKKQRSASSLSPSSSTSSSSSSSSTNSIEEDSTKKLEKQQQQVKRTKKGLERTRSSGIKIRPMINMPICSQGGRSNSLPPLFSQIRKGMLDR